MPTAPHRPCRRCHAAITRGRYCASCQSQESSRRRPSTSIYGRRWAKIRRRVLLGEQICRGHADQGITCAGGGRPLEVDHIQPRPPGAPIDTSPAGPDHLGQLVEVETPLGRMPRWSGNLQPLCRALHSAKTLAESGRKASS